MLCGLSPDTTYKKLFRYLGKKILLSYYSFDTSAKISSKELATT